MSSIKLDQSGSVHDKLKQAEINQVELDEVEPGQAELDHAELDQAELDHAELDHAELDQTGFDQAVFNQAEGAELDSEAADNTHPADAIRTRTRKSATAFRTISEVADELHVPQHVLRFWETKFPQVRPLKRGGGRRYYRPEDVALLRRVADLLYTQGYTIKGVQRLLRENGGALHEDIPPASADERLAAEMERTMTPQTEQTNKPAAPLPLLPMPGLLPAEPAQPVRSDNLRPAQARVLVRQKADPEAERLRALLADTLTTLEQLRALLG